MWSVRPSKPLRDRHGHLDQDAVIDKMVDAFPALGPILAADDEIIGGLPYLQIAWIAKALVTVVDKGEAGPVAAVLAVAEEVLRGFGQEGLDFIGAGLVEGIPNGSEHLLKPFAGPLLLRQIDVETGDT
jgi:hypothetical protein